MPAAADRIISDLQKIVRADDSKMKWHRRNVSMPRGRGSGFKRCRMWSAAGANARLVSVVYILRNKARAYNEG